MQQKSINAPAPSPAQGHPSQVWLNATLCKESGALEGKSLLPREGVLNNLLLLSCVVKPYLPLYLPDSHSITMAR